MNGKFESLIEGIRNDISSEGGNILVNSSFSQNTNYWTVANNVHFINVDGAYLWVDGSFYVEKSQVADIYNDNGQNVLRIRNTYILQQNAVMKVPEHEEGEEKTYSFSLFYKVLRAGSCGFGIPGTALYHEEQLSESDSYKKLSKAEKWDGTGNFELRFTGEILIYGVGLYPDEMADAVLKLQTQIDQTEEYIKLLATKEYVDSESGKIYLKYDGALEVTAEQISAINTKTDNINHTIETAGWITQADGVQLFAKKEMENGDSIVSAINVSPSTVKIQSAHLQLQGAVSFSMLSDYTTVNNRINNAADNANQALTDASSAWNKAVSAYNNADSAYTLANTAKTNAAKAIQDAANALSKAGSVQDALDDLPAWSKEASIIKALTSATVIVNGYIKTSMIDVDNLYCTSLAAVRGTVGGFTISGSTLTNGGTKLAGGVIEIGKESEDYYIRLGGVSASAGSGYALMLQNLMNSGYYGTNGASLYLKCGYPYYQNTLQRWIYAVDGQGTTKFELGVTLLTDPTNGISRIFIKAYQLAYKSQLVSTGLVSNPTWKALLYDTNTGYICWDY